MTRDRMAYCWLTRFFCCIEGRPEAKMQDVIKTPSGITALSLPNHSNMYASNAEMRTCTRVSTC